jgi:hypothetical protein
MIPLVEIFVHIDDFCKIFENNMKGFAIETSCKKKRNKPMRMTLSEIMTILIMFQLSHYKTFKDFYLNCILIEYRKEFPKAVSYSRFVSLMKYALMPMLVFMLGITGEKTGIYYIDSTKLSVCHNLRISRNKVFKDIAARGKTSTGWFFGFKLHIVINNKGEIMNFRLTKGNTDDRKPVEALLTNLNGWLFGDRGYISKKLYADLLTKGVELITNVKKGMQQVFLSPIKKCLLKKRSIIETIFDQLKNLLSIDHSRHRSPINFLLNIVSSLIAYQFIPKKPSARFSSLNLHASDCSLI